MKLTILSIMLAVITALSFSACSTNVTTESEPEATQAQETTQFQETTIEETTAVETPTVAEIEENTIKQSKKSTKAAAPDSAAAGYKTLYSSLLKSKGYKYFELIYVDEDDIPELVCFNGYAHADRTALYTVYNGKLSKVGKYGMYGSMVYVEKKNRIIGFTGVEEDVNPNNIFKIQNGKGVKITDHNKYKSKVTGNDGNYYKNNSSNRKKLLS
ncbi:MAG: hypothetical protein VZQ55_05100 [Ruminococcus sp.]|nr:hypothetical protein [Ruminococcus sp.]